jgi:hypothetical protein
MVLYRRRDAMKQILSRVLLTLPVVWLVVDAISNRDYALVRDVCWPSG